MVKINWLKWFQYYCNTTHTELWEQKKYFRNNNTTQKFTIITGFAKIYYTSLS